jgi:uncharacterized protein YbaP (TraB family)
MSMVRFLAALLLLAAPAAWGQAPGVPVFRVTAADGVSSLLIGSVHVPLDGLRQPAPSVLAGAKRLVMEAVPAPDPGSPLQQLVPGARETFTATGAYPPAPWAQALSTGEVAKLEAHVRCVRKDIAHPDFMLALQSPVVASILAAVPCGADLQGGRDYLLMHAAQQAGIAVVGLETNQEATRQLMVVPERIHVHMLQDILATDMPSLYARAVVALNAGEVDRAVEILDDTGDDPREQALFKDILIRQRNEAWRQPLERYLDQTGTVVVVGMGHLPGDTGLLAMLRHDGFAIEPTEVAAGP